MLCCERTIQIITQGYPHIILLLACLQFVIGFAFTMLAVEVKAPRRHGYEQTQRRELTDDALRFPSCEGSYVKLSIWTEGDVVHSWPFRYDNSVGIRCSFGLQNIFLLHHLSTSLCFLCPFMNHVLTCLEPCSLSVRFGHPPSSQESTVRVLFLERVSVWFTNKLRWANHSLTIGNY